MGIIYQSLVMEGMERLDQMEATEVTEVPAYGWDKPVSKLLDFVLLGRGEEGELGKRGDNGGRRSVGGEGGYPGSAQVFLLDSELNQLTNVGISLEANQGDEGEFMIYYNKCMLENQKLFTSLLLSKVHLAQLTGSEVEADVLVKTVAM